MTKPAIPTWSRRTLAGAFTVACLTASLTGCTSSGDAAADPTPSPTATQASPSPSPTLSKEEALEQANIETAKKRVVDYINTVNDVENDGFKNWQRLVEYWGEPLAASSIDRYSQLEKKGLHTTGKVVVTSQKVTDYTRDTGHESVRLTVCVDYSAIKAFNADGSAFAQDGPQKRAYKYLVQHQQDDYWTIDDDKADEALTC